MATQAGLGLNPIKSIVDVQLINEYKIKLKSNPFVVVDSINPLDHIAAYLAWCLVGGNIFVLNPTLDSSTKIELQLKVASKATEYKNKIFLHTTGTTGQPKIIVVGEKQIKDSIARQEIVLEVESDTTFLNLLPPFTAGFWYMVMPGIVDKNLKIVFGDKSNILESFSSGANSTAITPAVINLFKQKGINVDLKPFKIVLTGSSPVTIEHVQYLFDNGLYKLNNVLGSTEAGTPLLHHKSTRIEDTSICLDLAPITDGIHKLSHENELWVSGSCVCDNHEELGSVNGFLPTGDVFKNNNGLLTFEKRLKAEKTSSCGKYALI